MIPPVRPPSARTLARVKAVAERTLSADELTQALRQPVTESERAEVLSLVAWFRRRYPTPADRLAYVRRAYERWLGARRP